MRRLRSYKAILVAACLAVLAVGCDRRQSSAVGPTAVTVTNVVEVVREVVVTNVVMRTVAITNVIEVRREPVRILSARKTAPYLVAAKAFDAVQLRKLASDSAVRVVECRDGVVAVVEATDAAAKLLSAATTVVPLGVEAKIAAEVGEDVRVVPLSSIDVASVTEAVRALGGEIVQVVTAGVPAVRAKMSYPAIRKLAERGDVRRVERDGK